MSAPEALPIVYSCSGCSSAAEAADRSARALDRAGLAEMSCIAGVGGKVGPLVRKAQAGRPILALDGCPLACAKACLAAVGVRPDRHLVLSDLGVAKRFHAGPSPAELAVAEAAAREGLRALPVPPVQTYATYPVG